VLYIQLKNLKRELFGLNGFNMIVQEDKTILYLIQDKPFIWKDIKAFNFKDNDKIESNKEVDPRDPTKVQYSILVKGVRTYR
jgi:hypothetical protein